MREGWEYKKLGDVSVYFTGSRPTGGVGSLSEGALSLGGEHIGRNGHIVLNKPKYVSMLFYENNEKGHINKHDILLCKDGALTGKVAFVENEIGDMPAMINEHVFIIRAEHINQKYLFRFLYSPIGQSLLTERITGTAQGGLNGTNLKKIEIPLPPLITQQQIVSELDLLNHILEQKRQQLKEYDSLTESIFYEMFGDLVEDSKGWGVKKLESLVSINSKLVDPKIEPYCEMYHVGPANIISVTGEIVDVKKAKEETLISGKYLFDKGMILYSKIRPALNKVALSNMKGLCSADMYPLSPNKEIVNACFLRYVLSGSAFLKYAIEQSGRARMPKINREALFAFEFPLPPLTLQCEFEAKIQSIEQQKQLLKESIKETETLFQSRMDYWFNS